MKKLNLGSGYNRIDGFLNLDIDLDTRPDIRADIRCSLPFKDSSFDEVLCQQVLEHIFNYSELMAEIHRILSPGGILRVAVPEFGCKASIADPDHVRFFNVETFMHFCNPKWFNPSNFRFRGIYDFQDSELIKWKNKDEPYENAGKYYAELWVTLKKVDKNYNDYNPEAKTTIIVRSRD